MPICSRCSEKAVSITTNSYCKVHFIRYFEKKVLDTIKRFNLISKKDRVIIASSGGKDSTTLLYILKKKFNNVHALAIDEGIPGYRNKTLDNLKKFCKEYKIPLSIHTYKEEFGFTLTDAMKQRKDLAPCNVCGVLRRYLLNKKAKGFTKIATGHNMDDEAQSIMMNLMKANISLLARSGPSTGVSDRKFVPRVKPLYLCTEKEVATYAVLKNFGISFAQCPNARRSFRAFVRDQLNTYESSHPGAKRHLVETFLKNRKNIKQERALPVQACADCGEPSGKEVCNACSLVASVKNGNRIR
jgi:tRNA-5-methyluridine54 2-sulfurtransferase